MIPGLSSFFSQLTYAVSLDNPVSLGVLFVMGVLTDIGFPLLLSLEIFLMFASYYVGPLSLQVLLIVLMLLTGRETGAAILFWISYVLGDSFLRWLQRHFPWFLRSINHLKARIQKRTTLMVVLVRLTPGFLQAPSIITGSLHLRYLDFVLGVAFSSLIYDFGLVIFGYVASLTLKNAREDLQDYFIIGFIILVILMWVILFFRFRNIFTEKGNKN